MNRDELNQMFVALYRPDTGATHVETIEQHLEWSMKAFQQDAPAEWLVLGIFEHNAQASRFLENLMTEQ